ncbi:MAG: DUF4982 domain-containing protein [Ruminococcus sp.]|nr:DUF4982 domain-containing protein [Ruminococcus sp.]
MKKLLFCDKWEFSKCPLGTDYENAEDWQPVDLPHDWLIYNTNDLYENSTGWYRRTYKAAGLGDKRTSLRFEGVYQDCAVYVNGVLAGEWKYGYTTFEFDITDLLKEGDNLIAVRVNHQNPNSRWYSGAGIFRKVWLCTYEPCHILSDGVYVSADISGRVSLSIEVERPEDMQSDKLRLIAVLFDGTEQAAECEYTCTAADKSLFPAHLLRKGCRYSINTIELTVKDPILWDIGDPYLYTYSVALACGDEILDTVTGTFGFRKTEFTTDKGFFLNDRHVKLHGACMHHDLGALGAAVNRTAIKRQIQSLFTMGVNAIRTSHNPPSVELLELADEMGMLILDEGFDMWELKKTEYDYARFFPDWVEKDVCSWVRRDRNHPCLIGWSIGNEIYDTHASDRGQEVTSMLKALVSRYDYRHNACITIGSNYMGSENGQRCADILKVAGYNYAERLYADHHEAHPDWMIYGSETSSIVQSRGIYHFPKEQPIVSDDDEQCSNLGNSSPAWAAKSHEACIVPDRDVEFCAGQFIWTGFDYIGEPTPYNTKNSYFGQFDTAGFAKDSAYVFRSAWTSCKTDPFVHIYPYWDWNPGQVIDVVAASNAPKVAIFFNGEKIAEQDFDRKTCQKLTLDAKIPYSEGELCAVAYNEKGKEIARDTVRSFGDAAEIRLTPDKYKLRADGVDLIFVDISAFDSKGTFVANANNRVFVSVTGAGRLIGLDNGDSTDYEQYKGTSRRLFSGKLLAIIAGKNLGGEIHVKVTSPGLPERELILGAVEIDPEEFVAPGFPYQAENTERELCIPDGTKDIPVRKIELYGESYTFDPSCTKRTFMVKRLPENSVYSDIDYRLTTVNGIDTQLGSIVSSDSGSVTVECHGDGEFYLRALCKNGTNKYHVMSIIKLEGKDLGSAVIDPYSLVMGGLYTLKGGNVSDGYEHGAAFGYDGGWFGFENVDFGPVGSDTVTLPIFANYNSPVDLQIFDGTPENGQLIGDLEYNVPPIWLTYQERTYKLSKTLRGLHTISFRSKFRYDVKGFYFEKRRKENAELYAVNCVNIYGDKFTVGSDDVTSIGNNVILDLGGFDFEKAPEKIFITGRSQLPKNSIHIIFKSEDGSEVRNLCEFDFAENYTEREFPLENISGKGSVQVLFLPGSDFDLRSVRFQ